MMAVICWYMWIHLKCNVQSVRGSVLSQTWAPQVLEGRDKSCLLCGRCAVLCGGRSVPARTSTRGYVPNYPLSSSPSLRFHLLSRVNDRKHHWSLIYRGMKRNSSTPHVSLFPGCGGPMDIVIVLDGSNSIYPWEPMTAFLQKLIPSLDIGPQSTQVRAASAAGVRRWSSQRFTLCFPSRQVSVLQYAVAPKFEFRLNEYRTKEELLTAASRITQVYGHSTNTFQAIQYARLVCCFPPSVLVWPLFSDPLTDWDICLFAPVSQWGFHQSSGGRPGAAKVMVVVTDGESHDGDSKDLVIAECDEKGITRFGIAVSDDPRSPHRWPEEQLLSDRFGCVSRSWVITRETISTQKTWSKKSNPSPASPRQNSSSTCQKRRSSPPSLGPWETASST